MSVNAPESADESVRDALARAVHEADPFSDPSCADWLRDAAGTAVADVIAASFAVDADPSARADRDGLLDWALAEGTPADPRAVIGSGHALSPSRAALVGGFQAHLLDLDDTHELVRGHPSAVLVPALLALAGPDDPIDRLLAAYTVGLEVMARLGESLGPMHYQAGWHPTGTAGAVAAAAAGAHLRSLPVSQVATALSVAASRAGGVRAQFGTSGKPLHAGLASQSGVDAVGWAQAGLRTAEDAVLGPAGLLAAHGVPEEGRRAVVAGLGTPRMARDAVGSGSGARIDGSTGPAPGTAWALLDPGLWFKRYPFCSAAMAASDAAFALAAGLEGSASERAREIASVTVRMRPGADAALIHTAPRTAEEARFSVEAVVALILLGHKPSLEHLAGGSLDPLVAEVGARIRREHVPAPAGAPGLRSQAGPAAPEDPPVSGGPAGSSSPARAGAGRRDFWTEVVLRTTDGRTLTAHADRPLGAPENPLPAPALRDKLVAATGDAARADRIRSLLGVDHRAGADVAVPGTPPGTDRPTIVQLAPLLQDPPQYPDGRNPGDHHRRHR
ncbi:MULTISPECIES: MmgE/PrpD family protein [unclassified Brachybacterium]|uniref:MmgE/PrpD family protein n=1 Tax=unclassified Brachybacterium TaxID=2623841 RepID=UPI00360EB597